ncbi:MAG: VWA domain-containing protein [Bryobacterales bacterium]|nr:VWA domain-containing protein [Bryobacterales bacterium]
MNGKVIRCAVAVLLAGEAVSGQTARQSDYVLTGKVTMADGSPIPKPAAIERYCATGRATWEGRTDKNGNYILKGFDAASMGSAWRAAGVTGEFSCVLRASLPGYQSSTVELEQRWFGVDKSLPTILLYKRGAESVSLLDVGIDVPRSIGKAWGLAAKAIQAGNWAQAEQHLRTAVQTVPKFDGAWNALGVVCQSQDKLEEAGAAFRKAIELNPKPLPPYVSLARCELKRQAWAEAAAATQALIAVDTKRRYPEAYLYDASAAYGLREYERAEASARMALQLDPKHRLPRAEYVLGLVLEAKKEYAAAAEHMGAYLALEPKAADAGSVRAHIGRIGQDAPLVGVPDLNVLSVGEVTIPGGMAALRRAAHFQAESDYRDFFGEYCRRLIRHTTPGADAAPDAGIELHAYTSILEAYFASVGELARMAGMRDDRGTLTLSLATKQSRAMTEKALGLIGWKVVETPRGVVVEIEERAAGEFRQQVAAALGIDEIAMQDALQSGGTYTVELRAEAARLVGGDAWNDIFSGAQTLPGGLAEAFVRDIRLARVYAGLSLVGPEVAAELVAGAGLRGLVDRHALQLVRYSTAFVMKDGAVSMPGGPGAAAVWENFLHVKPARPAAFFRALLEQDGGKVLAFYHAVSLCDERRQAYLLSSTALAAKLYQWYWGAGGEKGPSGDALLAVMKAAPLDGAGRLRWPERDAAVKSAAMLADAVRLARIEDERGAPLEVDAAALLIQHGEEWRHLTELFGALPGLGAAELRALAQFEGVARGLAPTQRNTVMGEWHSLVALIALGSKAGGLDAAAGARAFRQVCEWMAKPDGNAVRILSEIVGGAAGLDEAVRTRLLKLDGVRRARLEQVLALQRAPSLEAALASGGGSKGLAALAGLVYAYWLNPDALLVSLDGALLSKHRFAPKTGVFAAASMVRTSKEPGSYFAGGFAGFGALAGRLALGPPTESAATAVVSKGGANVGGGAAEAAVPAEAVFRADARLVEVHAVVTDGRGRYIDDLPRPEFSIRDEGVAQTLAAFDTNAGGISVALVLDSTLSMHAAFPALKDAALKLIGELQPRDMVAVYSFNSTVAQLQTFTQDHAAARRAVVRANVAGDTALYDALVRVSSDFAGRSGRKVIVLFTDGDDNSSAITGAMAVRRLKGAGVPVYTVAQGAAFLIPHMLKELAEISNATGALPFRIQKPNEIREVFERISADLQHGYLLAFRPSGDGGAAWRRIEVQTRSQKGYKIRGRQGYFLE